MNLFNIPQKDPTAFLLYIWKIIDLPQISEKSLIYHVSFDLLLISPKKAYQLIQKSIDNKLLKKNSNNSLSLSETLEKKLLNWQKRRKQKIEKYERVLTQQKMNLRDFKTNIKSDFNVLLKAFLDKGTLNRAVAVSDESFNIIRLEQENGLIEAGVEGSKEGSYKIKINSKKKILTHNCHDFIERRSIDKKFCKHLVKLFLLLKENNENFTLELLDNIATSINEWEFTS